MKGALPTEQRKSLRLKDRLLLILKYREQTSRKEISKKARIITLSEEGLSFVADSGLPEIRKIALEILLPPPFETVKAEGEIIWRDEDKQKYGAQFTNISRSNSTTLDKYINRDTITKTIVVDQRFLRKKGIIEKPIEELRKPGFDLVTHGVKGIRVIREALKISRENLADIIGVSPTHLHLMEIEKIRPSRRILDRLIKVLNCKIEDIYDQEKWGENTPSGEEIFDKSLIGKLNKNFVVQTKQFREYLLHVKNDCDEFDKKKPPLNEQIEFIDTCKYEIFQIFDLHCLKIWIYFLNFNESDFAFHGKYYQSELRPLAFMDAFNEYIYEKPLGYPGDFVMMEYLYLDNFIGDSTFSKLIHRYACSVPPARANINRKVYFKKKIIEAMDRAKDNVKILSIACGPAREMIEYLNEMGLTNNYQFCCFDFEELALAQVNKEVSKLERSKNMKFNVRTFQCNIIDLIKNRKMQESLKNQDFIYCAGLIDYLSDKFAAKVTEILFDLLNKNGVLAIGNVSSANPSRAYMEIIMEWFVNHRSKDDMIDLARGIEGTKEVSVEEEEETGMNYFLSIRK